MRLNKGFKKKMAHLLLPKSEEKGSLQIMNSFLNAQELAAIQKVIMFLCESFIAFTVFVQKASIKSELWKGAQDKAKAERHTIYNAHRFQAW